jgi:hypothetical protein
MRKNEMMRQQIAAVFPEKKLADCFSTESQPEFCLLEDKPTSAVRLLLPGDPALAARKHLKVFNPNRKEITLLAIDGCMMSPNEPARCDALMFDDRLLSFMELKLDMTSIRNRASAMKMAIGQLEATIKLFDHRMVQHGKDWSGFEKEAIAVVGVAGSPKAVAGKQNDAVRFLQKHQASLGFIFNERGRDGKYKNEWVKAF